MEKFLKKNCPIVDEEACIDRVAAIIFPEDRKHKHGSCSTIDKENNWENELLNDKKLKSELMQNNPLF